MFDECDCDDHDFWGNNCDCGCDNDCSCHDDYGAFLAYYDTLDEDIARQNKDNETSFGIHSTSDDIISNNEKNNTSIESDSSLSHKILDIEEFIKENKDYPTYKKTFIIPRLGDEYPITLRTITKEENDKFLTMSEKLNDKGITEYEDVLYCTFVMMACLIEPDPFNEQILNELNISITKYNAKMIDKIEKKYSNELIKWKKENNDIKNQPIKEQINLIPLVKTTTEIIDTIFLPGEIKEIVNTILKLSNLK